MFTNKYDNNIKSYKGFGVVTPRHINNLNYKSEINNLTDKNLDYTPPLFETSYKNKPQDTNGYLNSKNYIKVPKTMNNYYYTSQQMDKIDKYPKYDKKNPFKFPPVLITSKAKKIEIDSKKEDKEDKKDKKDKNYEVISNRLINKKWYDDRYLYSFEPRYNDVIQRDRLYTWSYPFMPNTDNYYRDDINERGTSPIIFDNIDGVEPLPDYDSDSSDIDSVENFQETSSDNSNYNFIYIIVLCVIITFIIKKK
jgi:hypothetical protein